MDRLLLRRFFGTWEQNFGELWLQSGSAWMTTGATVQVVGATPLRRYRQLTLRGQRTSSDSVAPFSWHSRHVEVASKDIRLRMCSDNMHWQTTMWRSSRLLGNADADLLLELLSLDSHFSTVTDVALNIVTTLIFILLGYLFSVMEGVRTRRTSCANF